MREEFTRLIGKILVISQDDLSKEGRLMQINKPEKLLLRYRNMSNELTPARSIVALTHDEDNKVLQCEIQYLVTKKLKFKKVIDELKTTIPYPVEG